MAFQLWRSVGSGNSMYNQSRGFLVNVVYSLAMRRAMLDSKETVTLVRSSPDDNEDGFFISGTWRTVEEPFNFWSPEQLYKQQKRKLIKVEECI